jgi:hypothetical protein
MKKLFIIIIIFISFQSLSKADDISDFQIEGISIGDSALDHFSKKEIDDQASNGNYKSKKFKYVTLESNNFNTYEDIQIHYLSNDSKYIIHSISANINFPNSFPDCLILKDKVNKDLNTLFKDAEKDDWGKRALNNVDPTSQTFGYQNIYWLSNGNIIVSCRDYGKIKEGEGHRDYFAIMIDSKYFEEWLNNEAFD